VNLSLVTGSSAFGALALAALDLAALEQAACSTCSMPGPDLWRVPSTRAGRFIAGHSRQSTFAFFPDLGFLICAERSDILCSTTDICHDFS
jgi:hypothetical protein